MRFAYRAYEVTTPEPPGVKHIYRPVIPVQVIGPGGETVVLGLLDTGSDVTVLPAFVLGLINAKYNAGEQTRFRTVGGNLVTANRGQVELAVDHPDGSYRWRTSVAFLDGNGVAILGYQGFLEYFNTTFNTDRHYIRLTPNSRFPGERAA